MDDRLKVEATDHVRAKLVSVADELDFIAEGLKADPRRLNPEECAEMLDAIAADMRGSSQEARPAGHLLRALVYSEPTVNNRSDTDFMKEIRARQILQTLAQGINPLSGDELPGGTVLEETDVLRALATGVVALDQAAARGQRRARLPANSGRAWTVEEEATLFAAFRGGDSLVMIASRHGRTLRAIEDRLEMHGLITHDARSTKSPSKGRTTGPSIQEGEVGGA
jgi:hypothetical protein